MALLLLLLAVLLSGERPWRLPAMPTEGAPLAAQRTHRNQRPRVVSSRPDAANSPSVVVFLPTVNMTCLLPHAQAPARTGRIGTTPRCVCMCGALDGWPGGWRGGGGGSRTACVPPLPQEHRHGSQQGGGAPKSGFLRAAEQAHLNGEAYRFAAIKKLRDELAALQAAQAGGAAANASSEGINRRFLQGGAAPFKYTNPLAGAGQGRAAGSSPDMMLCRRATHSLLPSIHTRSVPHGLHGRRHAAPQDGGPALHVSRGPAVRLHQPRAQRHLQRQPRRHHVLPQLVEGHVHAVVRPPEHHAHQRGARLVVFFAQTPTCWGTQGPKRVQICAQAWHAMSFGQLTMHGAAGRGGLDVFGFIHLTEADLAEAVDPDGCEDTTGAVIRAATAQAGFNPRAYDLVIYSAPLCSDSACFACTNRPEQCAMCGVALGWGETGRPTDADYQVHRHRGEQAARRGALPWRCASLEVMCARLSAAWRHLDQAGGHVRAGPAGPAGARAGAPVVPPLVHRGAGPRHGPVPGAGEAVRRSHLCRRTPCASGAAGHLLRVLSSSMWCSGLWQADGSRIHAHTDAPGPSPPAVCPWPRARRSTAT